MISALSGYGNKMDKNLSEGLTWLTGKIRSLLGELEPRVLKDVEMAKEKRDKEREERKARVQKQREERWDIYISYFVVNTICKNNVGQRLISNKAFNAVGNPVFPFLYFLFLFYNCSKIIFVSYFKKNLLKFY